MSTYEDVFWIQEIQPNLLPWVNAPKINASIEIDGWQWGGSSQAETIIVNVDASTLIPNQVVEYTGFWFRPKKVLVQASWAVWIGFFNANWDRRDSTTTPNWNNGFLVWAQQGSQILRGALVDFTADGLNIRWEWTIPSWFFTFYVTWFSQI